MEMNELLIQLMKDRDAFYKRGIELSRSKMHSDSMKEIASAFAKAQSEFEAVTKSKQGYGYKYATLESLLDATRPVLNRNGLSITQFTDENNILHTRILHSSGEWFESRMQLKEIEGTEKKSYEQAYGTMMTYMRRYHALAVLGVQPSNEDTDGR